MWFFAADFNEVSEVRIQEWKLREKCYLRLLIYVQNVDSLALRTPHSVLFS